MTQLVEEKRDEIAALCREYGVKQLEIFGSAATGDFDPESSDLDFIVEFLDYGPDIFDRFFGFTDAIEALFGRSADFLSNRKPITNPYLRRSVDATRELLYDARTDSQAVAGVPDRRKGSMICPARRHPSADRFSFYCHSELVEGSPRKLRHDTVFFQLAHADDASRDVGIPTLRGAEVVAGRRCKELRLR